MLAKTNSRNAACSILQIPISIATNLSNRAGSAACQVVLNMAIRTVCTGIPIPELVRWARWDWSRRWICRVVATHMIRKTTRQRRRHATRAVFTLSVFCPLIGITNTIRIHTTNARNFQISLRISSHLAKRTWGTVCERRLDIPMGAFLTFVEYPILIDFTIVWIYCGGRSRSDSRRSSGLQSR